MLRFKGPALRLIDFKTANSSSWGAQDSSGGHVVAGSAKRNENEALYQACLIYMVHGFCPSQVPLALQTTNSALVYALILAQVNVLSACRLLRRHLLIFLYIQMLIRLQCMQLVFGKFGSMTA